MKLVSADTMRELDRRTMEIGDMSGDDLMAAAAAGVAKAVKRMATAHRLTGAPVLFLAGGGNNGGDAFVAASLLHEEGWTVECWLAGSPEKLSGEAAQAWRKLIEADVPFKSIVDPELWRQASTCKTEFGIVVDGLLGTGSQGEPRGLVAEAIDFLNAQSVRSLVVAIDAPSALSVRVDLTVALGLPKSSYMRLGGMDAAGHLEVVDIGIPDALVEEAEGESGIELLHPSELASFFPRRPHAAHKGCYGHLLCLGGSKGFSGAVTLAVRAAVRSGVGRVTAIVPEAVHSLVASAVPEVMVHSSRPDGGWSAILAGCGMGRTEATRRQVLQLLSESEVPVVLDADAVTVLANHTDAVSAAAAPVVLTPHPGEFATLFGLKVGEVQEDRLGMARMAANKLGAVVVLKGAGTVIAAPGQPLAINPTGNPGMATGGVGDVLAGMTAGLVAQGINLFGATCAAVWLHGRSGDLAAAECSQMSVTASDIIRKIPDAMRDISCR